MTTIFFPLPKGAEFLEPGYRARAEAPAEPRMVGSLPSFPPPSDATRDRLERAARPSREALRALEGAKALATEASRAAEQAVEPTQQRLSERLEWAGPIPSDELARELEARRAQLREAILRGAR